MQLSFAVVMLLVLILKADMAATGAADGITLCLQVIIPSLFPFFFITCYINPLLTAVKIPGFSWICKILYVPVGCEGLMLLGLIGGYPVGAQAVADAFHAGQIDKQQAQRLLGFCNNAGPAFIFGVCRSLFRSFAVTWLLWFIHMISALITAILLPKTNRFATKEFKSNDRTLLQAFRQSLSVTASVCGWVIIFKSILTLILSTVTVQNTAVKALLTGILELSGGIIALKQIANVHLRFILASALLALGGICVCLQTASVCGNLNLGWYIPGKLMQTFISILICTILIVVGSRNAFPFMTSACIVILCFVGISVIIFSMKKSCGNYALHDI